MLKNLGQTLKKYPFLRRLIIGRNVRTKEENEVTNPSKSYRERPILSDIDVRAMIRKADAFKNVYFRYRAKALVGLLKKFGKRRQEIVTLHISDIEVKEGFLYVTFTLVKKRKLGLAQYTRLMKDENPDALNKSYPQVVTDWEEWKKTKEGYRLKELKRIKKYSVKDRYIKYVLTYLDYLRKQYPKAEYLFPSGQSFFGDYIVYETQHLNGRGLLRIIKQLDSTAWVHLFRDGKGAEIAQRYPQSISAIAHVRDGLDLEKEDTAYHYVRRFSAQEVEGEIEET
jgi:integrase